jgi:Resolvase, N terminal domain
LTAGTDKDSDKRQRAAIQAFAKRAGYELVDEFYDTAVSGADPIDMRPGFAAMLERIEGTNSVDDSRGSHCATGCCDSSASAAQRYSFSRAGNGSAAVLHTPTFVSVAI